MFWKVAFDIFYQISIEYSLFLKFIKFIFSKNIENESIINYNLKNFCEKR